MLIDGISDEQGNRLINLQTIITSHSSHIVSECDFDDIKYFKRSSNTEVVSQNLKELDTRYKAEKDPERNHFKFLKQYLTLNYSEIFFADKAILFEGETEGILLPAMLKKVDEEHPSETICRFFLKTFRSLQVEHIHKSSTNFCLLSELKL